MTRTVLGHTVARGEDHALLDGSARYADDLALAPGTCWAVFVRSQDAHAALRAVDTRDALTQPGVLGIFTDADLALPPATAMSRDRAHDRPRLARDRVRFVGEPIAVVVAQSRAQAHDAAELVIVDTEPLPVVVDPLAALPDDAPLAHGDGWPDAEVVVRARFVNHRIAPVPMEPNACVAAPGRDGGLEVYASTQSVFGVRGEIAGALGLDADVVVVRAAAVGGGFGAKGGTYNEQIVVAALAQRLGRPVAWTETRRENLLNMTHGRGQIQDVDVGVRRDGTIVGIRVRAVADVGAYRMRGPFIPMVTRFMASGTYRFPHIEFHPVIVETNTTPTGPYRGAGRPEAAAMCERIVELVADELELDAIDVRRRNFVPPDAFPYTTPTGATYDTGEYERALDAALAQSHYAQWRGQQQDRRMLGDRFQLGIGIGCYVEVSGRGGEYGSVTIERDGSATVVTGSVPNGQGHETVWAQIASAVLGVPFEQVRVVHSDTTRVDHGTGTFGSRSLQLAGSAVHDAAVDVREQARRRVAEMLEASVDDIVVFDDGRLGVAGVPASALTWADIAAAPGDAMHAALDFDSDGSFPFGCHVAVVEVDTETGDTRLVQLTAVDDCGTVVNPMIAEGQVHGGIAQGIGQALFERVVYDDDGNPLTASLVDYAMPSAAELPSFSVHHTVTPTPKNPLGAKGIGESGTTGSTAAVWNAVVDALKPYGVRHLDMPFTPERVWRAIHGA
ncbi:MAG TPA: xanthine dehydrogenase family protein molybdopterin-binding subunit [Acidimicrobiia bacterium]|nr:xanthine dehydrogenase family protein molybdopterin-binding subunit [Acidimicrobiia bacterium]